MGLGADNKQMIRGLVLLLAVAFDVYNRSQGRRSITGLLLQNFGGKDRMPPSSTSEPTAEAKASERMQDTIRQEV